MHVDKSQASLNYKCVWVLLLELTVIEVLLASKTEVLLLSNYTIKICQNR